MTRISGSSGPVDPRHQSGAESTSDPSAKPTRQVRPGALGGLTPKPEDPGADAQGKAPTLFAPARSPGADEEKVRELAAQIPPLPESNIQEVVDKFLALKALGLSIHEVVKLAGGHVTEADGERLQKLAAQIPPLPEAAMRAVLHQFSALKAMGFSASDIVALTSGLVTKADKQGVDSGHTLEKYERGLDSTVAPKSNDDAEEA